MAFADLVEQADRAAQAHLGGVTVSYAPQVGAPVQVAGIFDANFVRVEGDVGEAGVELVGPAVFLRIADLPADPDQDNPTLTIAGVAYRVRERQRDGLGGIRLLLHRAVI